jgi:hypothetical protein
MAIAALAGHPPRIPLGFDLRLVPCCLSTGLTTLPECAFLVPKETTGMKESEYLTIGEVAGLIRKTPKTVRNLMSRSVFQHGVHYFRPRGSTPLFKRDALVQWIERHQTEEK